MHRIDVVQDPATAKRSSIDPLALAVPDAADEAGCQNAEQHDEQSGFLHGDAR
jgi:hypothetical protein